MTSPCTVSGNVADLTGAAIANAVIVFTRDKVLGQDGSVIVPAEASVTADGSGDFSIDLMPGNYTAATTADGKGVTFQVGVPDAATADLANLVNSDASVLRGTNSNGSYIKYPDGQMICWHELTLNPPNSALGGLYAGSSPTNWTFPEPFASGETPWVGTTDQTIGQIWVSAFCSGNTTAAILAFRATANGTSPTVTVRAEGKWK